MTRKEIEEKRLRRIAGFQTLFFLLIFAGIASFITGAIIESYWSLGFGLIAISLSIVFLVFLANKVKAIKFNAEIYCEKCGTPSLILVDKKQDFVKYSGTGGIASYILFFIPGFLSSHAKIIKVTKKYKCGNCENEESTQITCRASDL
ncbi:MAG: MFS transporter [Firmicutes bacterium]|nr:MFS transporter [Bacillota bacterium]